MSADPIGTNAPAPAANHETFEQRFCIALDHPSLPGHFPGHPLVPGVLLLEHVAIALREWRGRRLARLVEAKFVAPLLPAEPAVVRLMPAAAGRIRFEIFRGETLLARGSVEAAA